MSTEDVVTLLEIAEGATAKEARALYSIVAEWVDDQIGLDSFKSTEEAIESLRGD